MSLSRRELILQAMAATLGGLTSVGDRIYRSRVEAFSRDEAPALVIEAGQAVPTIYANCKLNWELDVLVSAYARGPIPDTAADAVLTEAHALLMADRTVGGLAIDVVPATVTTDLERADLAACWLQAVFRVSFRTAVDDLTLP